MRNRQHLLNQLPATSLYQGTFATLPNGTQWYLHWLNSWLSLDASSQATQQHIDMLKAIARIELDEVHPLYVKSLHESNDKNRIVYSHSQHQSIVNALRARENRVLENLSSVFADLPSFPKVKIRASSLPESFPAPGIYDGENQVFYYHFTDKKILDESLDWLYLHEAVPGHHMQRQMAQKTSLCPTPNLASQPMVTIEGWGAYVETLGEELGLFSDPASLAYALEWRVLRALRVLIDIGIHLDGWSDAQALSLWREYLPQRMHIGQREVARIRRWPVQAITYVYGKHLIEKAIAALDPDHAETDTKRAHTLLLTLSNHPPHALVHLPALINQKEITHAN